MTDGQEQKAAEIFHAIRTGIGSVLCSGLEPKRIYMNQRTKDLVIGSIQMYVVSEIVQDTKGCRFRERIFGVPVGVCNDLEDGEIDVSVKG